MPEDDLLKELDETRAALAESREEVRRLSLRPPPPEPKKRVRVDSKDLEKHVSALSSEFERTREALTKAKDEILSLRPGATEEAQRVGSASLDQQVQELTARLDSATEQLVEAGEELRSIRPSQFSIPPARSRVAGLLIAAAVVTVIAVPLSLMASNCGVDVAPRTSSQSLAPAPPP